MEIFKIYIVAMMIYVLGGLSAWAVKSFHPEMERIASKAEIWMLLVFIPAHTLYLLYKIISVMYRDVRDDWKQTPQEKMDDHSNDAAVGQQPAVPLREAKPPSSEISP